MQALQQGETIPSSQRTPENPALLKQELRRDGAAIAKVIFKVAHGLTFAF
jgi:hypothetical protein